MKQDIDHLMKEEGIDALLVTGPAQHNPPMVYLTGGAHLTRADLIKKRGSDPVLFHHPMERDEAVNTGLRTVNLSEYRLEEERVKAGWDELETNTEKYCRMFRDMQVDSGSVAISGQADAGEAFAVFTRLQERLPGINFVGQVSESVLLKAMSTKDEVEVERIRKMGRITVEVVDKTANYLTNHAVQDNLLVREDGRPLTIGDVKRRISMWLSALGAENPHGVIFAAGRDAGVPHSSGEEAGLLRLGETIVFDIFPCEAGGGYHFDFTRSWCLGYAPDEVQEIYNDVLSVYKQIMGELRMGGLCSVYQERTCELFEQMGHVTIKSEPQTQEGYVHSLGHGLGLNVHEYPSFRSSSANEQRLEPGVIVTIEPGLYYPERNMGIRLEDTVWVRPDGELEILAEYPLDLVLHMKG
jgi:Xaa-Pro aminopeptidase